MLNKLSERSRNEQGFTLIELLVVILIIGILAAIALPAFLGQRAKGQDAAAKSDARNAVSEVESFYATEETYANADLSGSGLDIGSGAGQVSETGDATTYVITAHSKSGGSFTMTKGTDGKVARTCSDHGKGACPSTGNW